MSSISEPYSVTFVLSGVIAYVEVWIFPSIFLIRMLGYLTGPALSALLKQWYLFAIAPFWVLKHFFFYLSLCIYWLTIFIISFWFECSHCCMSNNLKSSNVEGTSILCCLVLSMIIFMCVCLFQFSCCIIPYFLLYVLFFCVYVCMHAWLLTCRVHWI